MIRRILKQLNDAYGFEKKYGFKDDQIVQTQETDRHIEIENGDCVQIQGYSTGQRCQLNYVKSYKFEYAIRKVFSFCMSAQNLFHIITLIVIASLQETKLSVAIPKTEILVSIAIPFLLSIISLLMQEIYYAKQLARYDKKINNERKCKRLARIKNSHYKNVTSVEVFEVVTWGQLRIGDVVVLEKDEYSPADILILDMWESKCLVKTSFIDDSTDDKVKYAPHLTAISKQSTIKGKISEYRRLLSGRIDLKRTEYIGNFRGFLDLKKDPISEKFNESNLITKFSQITYSDWIVGIVVLAGTETYSMNAESIASKEYQRTQPSFLKRKWSSQSWLFIAMILFFSFVVVILRLSMNCFKLLKVNSDTIMPIFIDFLFTFPAFYITIHNFTFTLFILLSNAKFSLSFSNRIANQSTTTLSNSQSSTKKTNNDESRGYSLNQLVEFSELALNTHVIFNSLRGMNQKPSRITTVCLKDRYFKLRSTETNAEPPVINNQQQNVSPTKPASKNQYGGGNQDFSDQMKFVNGSGTNTQASIAGGYATNSNSNELNFSRMLNSRNRVFKEEEPSSAGIASTATATAAPKSLVQGEAAITRQEPQQKLLRQISELDSRTFIADHIDDLRQINQQENSKASKRVSISENLLIKDDQYTPSRFTFQNSQAMMLTNRSDADEYNFESTMKLNNNIITTEGNNSTPTNNHFVQQTQLSKFSNVNQQQLGQQHSTEKNRFSIVVSPSNAAGGTALPTISSGMDDMMHSMTNNSHLHTLNTTTNYLHSQNPHSQQSHPQYLHMPIHDITDTSFNASSTHRGLISTTHADGSTKTKSHHLSQQSFFASTNNHNYSQSHTNTHGGAHSLEQFLVASQRNLDITGVFIPTVPPLQEGQHESSENSSEIGDEKHPKSRRSIHENKHNNNQSGMNVLRPTEHSNHHEDVSIQLELDHREDHANVVSISVPRIPQHLMFHEDDLHENPSQAESALKGLYSRSVLARSSQAGVASDKICNLLEMKHTGQPTQKNIEDDFDIINLRSESDEEEDDNPLDQLDDQGNFKEEIEEQNKNNDQYFEELKGGAEQDVVEHTSSEGGVAGCLIGDQDGGYDSSKESGNNTDTPRASQVEINVNEIKENKPRDKHLLRTATPVNPMSIELSSRRNTDFPEDHLHAFGSKNNLNRRVSQLAEIPEIIVEQMVPLENTSESSNNTSAAAGFLTLQEKFEQKIIDSNVDFSGQENSRQVLSGYISNSSQQAEEQSHQQLAGLTLQQQQQQQQDQSAQKQQEQQIMASQPFQLQKLIEKNEQEKPISKQEKPQKMLRLDLPKNESDSEVIQKRLSIQQLTPVISNVRMGSQRMIGISPGIDRDNKKHFFENISSLADKPVSTATGAAATSNSATTADKEDSFTRDLLFAIAICHESKSKGEREKATTTMKHVHLEQDTADLIEFAKSHAVTFECACMIAEQLHYLVSTKKKKNEKVQILSRQSIGQRYYMIVQRETGEKQLYIRDGIVSSAPGASFATPSYLVNSVSGEKKIKFDSLLGFMKSQGERVIFYSKKPLSDEQFTDFQNLIRLSNSESDISGIYTQFLQAQAEDTKTPFEVLGFIGIEEEFDIQVKEMIHELQDFGQKVWVLTSDSQERTLESCYNYNVLNAANSSQNIDFSTANIDELFYKTRNHLEVLRRIFSIDFTTFSPQQFFAAGTIPATFTMQPAAAAAAASAASAATTTTTAAIPAAGQQQQGTTVNLQQHEPTTPKQNGLGSVALLPLLPTLRKNQNSSNILTSTDHNNQLLTQKSIQFGRKLTGQQQYHFPRSSSINNMHRGGNSRTPSSNFLYQDSNNHHQQQQQQQQQQQHQQLDKQSTPKNTAFPSSNVPAANNTTGVAFDAASMFYDPTNYAVIISGESLNTIRNDEYLWNHFCLIMYFARTLVGYNLTHEQKAFLGQTITTKFKKQNQRVVNIISSQSDFERLGYASLSIYVKGQSDVHAQVRNTIVAQHCQLVVDSTATLLKLMFRESKFMLEIIEESMYLAVHRAYLLALTIIAWTVATCTIEVPFLMPYKSIFFHFVQYFITFVFFAHRKREKFLQDCDLSHRSSSSSSSSAGSSIIQYSSSFDATIEQQQKHSSRRYSTSNLSEQRNFYTLSNILTKNTQQQLAFFNLKIFVMALFDSGVLYAFFYTSYDYENGSDIDVQSQRTFLVIGIHLLSFCRVFDIHFVKLSKSFFVYVICFIFFLVIEELIFDGYEVYLIMEHIFKNLYFINLLLFLVALLAKNIIESLFFGAHPVSLVGLRKYLLSVESKSNNIHQESQIEKNSRMQHHATRDQNRKQSMDTPFVLKNKEQQGENLSSSANTIGVGAVTTSKFNGLLLPKSPNQMQSTKQVGEAATITNATNTNNTTNVRTSNAPSSFSWLLTRINYRNPISIIRSVFKDKEMDSILSSLLQDKVNLSQTQMMAFFLRFQIKELELKFEKSWALLIAHSNRAFYVFHFIAFEVAYEILVLVQVTNDFKSSEEQFLISYSFTGIIILGITLFSLTKYYSNENIAFLAVAIVLVRSLKFVLLSFFKEIIAYPTEIVLHLSVAFSCLRFSHYNLLLQGVIMLLFLIIETETSLKTWNMKNYLIEIGYGSDNMNDGSDVFLMVRMCFYISYLIILMLLVSHKYYMNQTLRSNFLSEHNLFEATTKVKGILSILLPKFIREKIETMKQGNYRVAEKQDEVVIVFCDICNFDDLIFSEKTNAVRILNKLYRQFDLSCQENGLQKIETVGKTYLAAAGITDVERMLKAENRLRNVIPAKRALNFAFALQKIAQASGSYLPENSKIIIKVGIHLGPAISGVIGHHKPQFSLIGDTVNTTSRVCSTGESNTITISKEVYKKIQFQSSNCTFIERQIEAKGKGTITTYQVNQKTKSVRPSLKESKKFMKDDPLIGKIKPMSSSQRQVSSKNPISPKPQHQQQQQQQTSSTLAALGIDQPYKLDSQKRFSVQKSNSINSFDLAIPSLNEISPSPSNMVSLLTRKVQTNSIGSIKSIPLHAIPESTNRQDSQKHSPSAAIRLPIITSEHLQENIISDKHILPSSQQRINQVSSEVSILADNSPIPSIQNQISLAATASIASNTSITTPKRTLGRNFRKANSVTIVELKPRFQASNHPQNGEMNSSKKRGSNEWNGMLIMKEDNASSPRTPTKNQQIKQIEKDLLNRIELEPFRISLKERLPLQLFQTLNYDMVATNNNNNANAAVGTSSPDNLRHTRGEDLSISISSANLRIGLCSIGSNRSTEEQQHLQSEFLKGIMKQQIWAIATGFASISVYYSLKLISLFQEFSVNRDDGFAGKSSTISIFIVNVIILIGFICLAGGFKSLHHHMQWHHLRIAMIVSYFVMVILVSMQSILLGEYMQNVQEYIFKNQGKNVSGNDELMVNRVVMPTQIIFCLEIEIVFMMFTSLKCFDFLEKIAALVVQLIAWLIYAIICDEVEPQMIMFLLIAGILHLRIQFIQVQNEVRSFNNMKTLEAKKHEHESLLQNLLPNHILDQYLNSTKKEIPLVCEELDDVTLLFADIAGFTKYSSTTDPIVVVNMLRKLFTDFDDHCFAQNVYKLYTIGDCYVCFGVANVRDRNPAQEAHNVIRFAFDMIRIIEQVRQLQDCELQMRIGVHTGKLYGGVVGTEIVRYDVYGVDVIVANKMESNGEIGRVMVSEVTRNLLEENYPGEFEFEFHQEVPIKQLHKSINGYFVRFNLKNSEFDEQQPQFEGVNQQDANMQDSQN